MPIVLYGSSAAMIVEVEETCARLGETILAIVKNVDGQDYALSKQLVVFANDVPDEMKVHPYLISIFTPGHRAAARRDAESRGFHSPATIVDPTATVAASAALGKGTYVNAGVVIGGATRLGEYSFINRAASIGHHVETAEFVAIGPGATIAGAARIGKGTMIGAGAVVLPGMTIGSNAVVAAGTVVREPVGDHCMVAGNPARVIRTEYPGYRNLSV
jgi:sugar O-acyltransferase (sialic acid O-acetyltransferase NeuD family)